jgi:hypothetical protein
VEGREGRAVRKGKERKENKPFSFGTEWHWWWVIFLRPRSVRKLKTWVPVVAPPEVLEEKTWSCLETTPCSWSRVLGAGGV